MTTQPGRPIVAGYEWRLRVQVTATPARFPVGVALRAQLRTAMGAANALATLSTADGSIARIDNNTIELVIAGSVSASWRSPVIVCDVIRIDLAEPQHGGFRLRIPVVQPVTRVAP